jgi:hypothetical protein
MANSTITSYGNTTSGAIKGETSANVVGLFIDPEALRQPEYTVYLHTISRRGFMQPNGIYRNVAIPACPKDKRSFCFMKVQHPVQLPRLNPDDVNGPPLWKYENAKAVALGICNPDYSGTDLSIQDKELDSATVLSSGECNLTRQGVFASLNAEPTEEELKKAEARREKYYRFRLAEADGLERSNPRQLQYILIEDHHMAAEYFGIEANWHRAPSAKVDCPNCGQKIPGGVAFHYDNGRVCVLDWERAWLAGAVKKDDVPEPRRWWSEENAANTSVEALRAQATDLGIEVDMRWSANTLQNKIREAQAS